MPRLRDLREDILNKIDEAFAADRKRKPKRPPRPPRPQPEPEPDPTHQPPGANDREKLQAVLAEARSMVGRKSYCTPPRPALYAEPTCTDCSGLTAWCYYVGAGLKIGGGSVQQWGQGRLITRDHNAIQRLCQIGDLLFFNTGYAHSHVGLYTGDGHIVHAMNEDDDIREGDVNTRYLDVRFEGAWRLLGDLDEVVVPPVDPPVNPPRPEPTPITIAAAPFERAALPLTLHTSFRAMGDMGAGRLRQVLMESKSPMLDEASEIYRACGPMSALAVAQSYKESRYGVDENAQATHNPLGLLDFTGRYPVQWVLGGAIPLIVFSSWADAFAHWWSRMTDANYKAGVYMPREMGFEQYIVTYVGGPGCWSSRGATCGNDETWVPGADPQASSITMYAAQTLARINRYYSVYQPDPTWSDYESKTPAPDPVGGFTPHTVAGSNRKLWLPDDLEFVVALTPVGPNRRGYSMNWQETTAHETGNERVGANAMMHSNWQDDGTPGHPDGYIGVHFYVDDEMLIQKIPVNEQGVHAGDSRNQRAVGVELAVNADRDRRRAERNAAATHAALMHVLGTTALVSMYPHGSGAGCPRYLRQQWPEFEAKTDAMLDDIIAVAGR